MGSGSLGIGTGEATIMLGARLLADGLVVFHALYVAFVVVGLALIVIGLARGWGWVRNVWFRAAHLAAIGIVVFEEAVGIRCPLTVWEARLRAIAGQPPEGRPADFLGYWAHRLIFVDAPPWAFTVAYLVFGACVLAVFVIGPPRWPWGWPSRPRRIRSATSGLDEVDDRPSWYEKKDSETGSSPADRGGAEGAGVSR